MKRCTFRRGALTNGQASLAERLNGINVPGSKANISLEPVL